MIEIRSVKLEDSAQIAQVHVKSWQTTYQKIIDEEALQAMRWEDKVGSWRQTIECLGDQSVILGAFKGKQLVGFLSGGSARQPLEICDAEIYAIYLLEECRRKGVGKQLMEAFFNWLKENEFHSCFVWIAEENPYQDFYLSQGAVKTDHRSVSRFRYNYIPTVAYIWPQINE